MQGITYSDTTGRHGHAQSRLTSLGIVPRMHSCMLTLSAFQGLARGHDSVLEVHLIHGIRSCWSRSPGVVAL
ncbi:hypothetical protein L210DRAFT_3570197 [Boletus edulis BED1]|uniref:Uncharacterized protein n=1 Tax=Boletus edulis BED1 TaxID=1328754 RepID=A0AAD4BDZ0_BOLED|nr:hypothetical protein L210DRAFT_3570197 [Boletus edulis BED1]